jgi:hypothetical protein
MAQTNIELGQRVAALNYSAPISSLAKNKA